MWEWRSTYSSDFRFLDLGKGGLFDLKICTSVTVTGGKMKMVRQDAVSGPRRQGRLVRRASFMLLMIFCLRRWVGAEVYGLQEIFQYVNGSRSQDPGALRGD